MTSHTRRGSGDASTTISEGRLKRGDGNKELESSHIHTYTYPGTSLLGHQTGNHTVALDSPPTLPSCYRHAPLHLLLQAGFHVQKDFRHRGECLHALASSLALSTASQLRDAVVPGGSQIEDPIPRGHATQLSRECGT